MTMLPITLTIAGAAALINLWLGFRVSRLRRAPHLMIGDGGDPRITAAMRAHSNFVEYAPFVLILIAGIELAGGSATWLWAAGIVFVLARLAHPFGMGDGRPLALRAAGMLGTAAVLIGLAGWALSLTYSQPPIEPPVTFAQETGARP